MKLLLLLTFSIAAFGQTCSLTATSATGTVCLQGPKGDKGDTGATGATGAQGPPGPAGAGISTITVANGVTTITGPLVVTGSISTGAPASPTVWQITRSDGQPCTVKFSPTNPASNTTSMVITCP